MPIFKNQNSMINGKPIGLALSGGAAKGFAHLGVLQAMEEKNLKPDFISGSSAGAIVAAFYSDGYKPYEILKILSSYKLSDYMKPGWIKSGGLMKSIGLYKILSENLITENIENLSIPVWVCITNLNSGKAEYHNSGKLARKVLASSSIPVFFRPVRLNNCIMVDGGVCDNLPVKPLVEQGCYIIAVNVNNIKQQNIKQNIKSIAGRVFQLIVNKDLNESVYKADLLIEPDLPDFGYLNLKNAEKYFNSGYNCAKKLFENILSNI